MARALIIGGGLGGLAAALFAARRGHSVTVLERDPPPGEGSTADDDFAGWRRPGLPQARQGHLFLARSTRVLHEEAPDVLAAVLARGAIETPLADDDKPGLVLARRPVYEGVIRRAVEQEPGVTVLSGVTATGLRVESRTGGVPVVTGARSGTGDDLSADLTVDACGRRSAAPRWLAGAGARSLAEISHDCRFVYLCRHYRLRAGSLFPSLAVPLVAMYDYATVIVFPADNGTFAISIVVATDDPCRRRLRDGEVFDRFLRAVPLTRDWLDRADPTSEPSPMGNLINRWRRLADGRGPVVGGFVLAGDAAMQTSPTLGRGVSLAFAHAQELARTLDQCGGDPIGFVARFEAWTAEHLGVWFESQVAEDRVRNEGLAAALRGDRIPAPSDPIHRLIMAFGALRDDPVVSAASARAFNLLTLPSETIRDRRVLRHLNKYLNKHQTIEARPEGPGRAQFERLVAP